MPLKITCDYSFLVRAINAEGITFVILAQVGLEFYKGYFYGIIGYQKGKASI